MALKLPHSIFIHVPKTGGLWVRKAIGTLGIHSEELGCQWHVGVLSQPFHICLHNGINDIDASKNFTFAFVRNPTTYYQSYWSYRMQKGWSEGSWFDRTHKNDTFHAFVLSILEMYPEGWVSGMYQHLLGNEGDVDFIGKQENLTEDLIRALQLAGETFDEQAIRSLPPRNQASNTDTWREQCTYTEELLRRVERAEHLCMERFAYLPAHHIFAVLS